MPTRTNQVSFSKLSKADQLSLLGDIYEKLRLVGPRRVHLDVVLERTGSESPACDSIGCVVGWAATDRSLADRLGVRLSGYNYALGGFDPNWSEDSLMLTRLIDRFKNADVHPNDGFVSCLSVFKESRINSFLFVTRVYPETRWSHYRAALGRLLYLGHLIDSGVDLEATGWYLSTGMSLADDFAQEHRKKMVRCPFVIEHLKKL